MQDILVYGHGDKSPKGFQTELEIEQYLGGGIFRDEDGRYRYSQKKRADIIVLSRDGFAFGHFVIDSMVLPSEEDKKAYPPVKKVYLISKSVRYKQKVHMLSVGITGYQFGKHVTDQKFKEILELALECEDFYP